MASDPVTAAEAEAVIRAEWKRIFLVLRGENVCEHEILDKNNMVLCHGDWHKLYAFTLQRQREIEELKLAIEASFCPETSTHKCAICAITMPLRKLAKERMAELLRGMKGAR